MQKWTRIIPILIGLCLPALAVAVAPTTTSLRVLVVTGGHWFDEEAFYDAFRGHEGISCDFFAMVDESEVFEDISDWQYDAMVFYNMTQKMTPLRQEHFLALLDMGVGITCLHHAGLSWFAWEPSREIFGTDFPQAGGPYGFHLNTTVTYQMVEPRHPITRGIEDFTTHDETYTNYYGDGAPGARVIVETDSKPSDDQIAWVNTYANARIYTLQGGHDRAMLGNPYFQNLLAQGIRWTAGRLPLDENSNAVLEESSLFRERRLAAILEHAATWNVGDSRWAPRTIEIMIQEAQNDPDQRARLADFCARIVLHEEATGDARIWAFRQLARLREDAQVGFLADWIEDPVSGYMAVRAIEATDTTFARLALEKAVAETTGTVRLGTINALGRMGHSESIDIIAPVMTQPDTQLATAAMAALGSIGGDDALDALRGAHVVPSELRRAWEAAVLDVIDGYLSEGDEWDAEDAVEWLLETGPTPECTASALVLFARADPQEALDPVEKALHSDYAVLREGALAALRIMPRRGATHLLVKNLYDPDPMTRLQIVSVLGERGDHRAYEDIAVALNDEHEAVRVAAIRALAGMPDSATVGLLAHFLSDRQSPAGEAAREVLNRLSAEDIDAALMQYLQAKTTDETVRAGLIEVLTARRVERAYPLYFEYVEADDRAVRGAAFDALALVGKFEDLDRVLDMVLTANRSTDRRNASSAARAIMRRAETPEASFDMLQSRWDQADSDKGREELVRLMGALETEKALGWLTAQLEATEDTALERALVRVLGEWPDAAPAEALLRTARETEDTTARVIALRGYLRLVSAPSERSEGETLSMLLDAEALLDRQEEQRLLLGNLSNIQRPGALKAALAYLDQDGLTTDAAHTVLTLSQGLSLDYPEQVATALNKTIEVTTGDLQHEAREQLVEAEKLRKRLVQSWTFTDGADGWRADNDCTITTGGGFLRVTVTGDDPFTSTDVDLEGEPMILTMRLRYTAEPPIQVFWQTDKVAMGQEGSWALLDPVNDGEWREYEVPINPVGHMDVLRLDTGWTPPGGADFDWIRLLRQEQPEAEDNQGFEYTN